jgi:hypothetical protein
MKLTDFVNCKNFELWIFFVLFFHLLVVVKHLLKRYIEPIIAMIYITVDLWELI